MGYIKVGTFQPGVVAAEQMQLIEELNVHGL
jgi:hypothetical protein